MAGSGEGRNRKKSRETCASVGVAAMIFAENFYVRLVMPIILRCWHSNAIAAYGMLIQWTSFSDILI